jgi:hypothetical protein
MASSLIDRALDGHMSTKARRWVYRHNVNGMATGIVTNSLYSKLRPTTLLRSIGFSALFGLGRGWVRAWRAFAGLRPAFVELKSRQRRLER